jgi:hypothetical protein
MADNLVFTADGRLLAGETVLAQVAGPDDEGFPQLVVGDHDYNIVRPERLGWHFELIDRWSGKRTCDLVPFRLRRGGRLRWSDGVVLLRRRPLRGKRWWFLAESGHRIEATARPVGHGFPGSVMRPLEVTLRSDQGIGPFPHEPITLAFGCWLVIQWDSMPLNVGGS